MTIRLAMNATPLLGASTGVAKYIVHLMREVEKCDEIEPHYFYLVAWEKALQFPPARAMEKVDRIRRLATRILPNTRIASAVYRNFKFASGAYRLKIDLYHEPNFIPYRFAGSSVITVHDLSWLRYPETHPVDRVRALERRLPKAIERSSYVLVDSEFVRREVIEVLGVPEKKVFVSTMGAGDEYMPRSSAEVESVLAGFGLEYKRYLLSVGTLEPRKNLGQLFSAYRRLPETIRNEYPLVVAGMKGWGSDALGEEMRPLLAKGQIRVLGYVPDNVLPSLYSGATMLIYPSIYEGFGLPPLEAMASGTAVITSDRASLPEVVGDAGIKIDPLDVDGLTESILGLIESGQERDRRVAAGIERAKLFTWERCAAETIAVYKRAVS